MISRPIPPDAIDRPPLQGLELNRRHALKLLAGGMAFALNSCGPPNEEIVPYVELPDRITPGIPLRFATALPLAGYGRGVLVTSHEGRPTKIDGNPRHPTSLGATDIFAEAAIMSLYDPNRSKAVRAAHGVSSWNAFAGAWLAQLEQHRRDAGAGLRVVTGRITSPTLARQLASLTNALPEARWYRYEPLQDDAEQEGAKLAFGRPLTSIPKISETSVLLALDADPIGSGPEQIRLSNEFSRVRQAGLDANRFLRLYVAEPAWTLTGANSDERLTLAPQLLRNIAISIANEFGASLPSGELPSQAEKFARAAAADLKANTGRAMVLVGRSQPAPVHALCHWINAKLGAPVDLIEPVDPAPSSNVESLSKLADDLANNRVTSLIVLGTNPAYSTPGALGIDDAIARIPFSAHAGLYEDETATHCKWHLPLSHTLEGWSDIRAVDGTASVIQPLIRPLYDTRTAHEVVGLIGGSISADAYALVRETWRDKSNGPFDEWWRGVLYQGVVPATAHPPVKPGMPELPQIAPASAPSGLTLTLLPDPSVWDGSFSTNPWLQECPKPITSEVWGNSLHMSPQDAVAHHLADGEIVRVSHGNFSVESRVIVQAGQAQGVVTATLGHGRTQAGPIGSGVGFNAYRLQRPEATWIVEEISLSPTGRHDAILRTQRYFKLEGDADEILPTLPVQELRRDQPKPREDLPTLLPEWPYDTYKWAMVIDTSVCIGCNACVIACQSENNVPVVGPDEIGMGRDMHWLRIDTYFVHQEDNPPGFQPVPCMHCEQAPCEPVCPVGASIHDSEGLNVQVYNRCIGTRFCQSNCPYKVRRFNFFGYSHDDAYANLGSDVTKARFNPDVTVRARGVMEKCSYCVQRISSARRQSEKADQPIPDGGVVTACQAACPTRAIAFGDLNNKNAKINALRQEPHHYALLGHLGTRPRTTYLARLGNPNPRLGKGES